MTQNRVTDPNFIDITRALNHENFSYFIGNGTLLRLYRDGDFAPESGDIDICFREGAADRRKLNDLLVKMGFEVAHSDEHNVHAIRHGGRTVDLNFFSHRFETMEDGRRCSQQVIEWTVQPKEGLRSVLYFNWHKFANLFSERSQSAKQTDRLLMNLAGTILSPIVKLSLRIDHRLGKINERHLEYRIPTNLLETELIVTKNASWYQPVQVEAVLESLYGTDWRIPTGRKDWFDFAKESPD